MNVLAREPREAAGGGRSSRDRLLGLVHVLEDALDLLSVELSAGDVAGAGGGGARAGAVGAIADVGTSNHFDLWRVVGWFGWVGWYIPRVGI